MGSGDDPYSRIPNHEPGVDQFFVSPPGQFLMSFDTSLSHVPTTDNAARVLADKDRSESCT